MFESWTPGDRWTAVRYPDYAPHPDAADGQAGGHTAYIDTIQYIEVPNQTTRIAALQTGEIDLVREIPAELLADLENDPNVALYDNPPFRLLGHFNYTLEPFSNRDVRQALVMAYRNQEALMLAAGDSAFSRLCPSLMQCGSRWETSAGSTGSMQRSDSRTQGRSSRTPGTRATQYASWTRRIDSQPTVRRR